MRIAPTRSLENPGAAPRTKIIASPFVLRDPANIPQRCFLYGTHYIRSFVSATVAPGGVGKSTLCIVEAVAMASGIDLLGVKPSQGLKVWVWNGEDPLEEIERRICAACLHYGVGRANLEGRLFVDSGRDTEIIIATQTKEGTLIAQPVVDEVVAAIQDKGIDVVIIDPFVASHRVSENDNGAIDAVARTWARIADVTNCTIDLVHHSRKTGGAEVTVEDARGASALLAAARSARVLNPMSQEEGTRLGVEKPRLHFRVDNGKSNMAPPAATANWFKLVSVALGNGPDGSSETGDQVAVATKWGLPNPLDGISVTDLIRAQQGVSEGKWRENHQANDWVGKPIAKALGLNVEKPADKKRVQSLLKIWTASGMFVVVEGFDRNRQERSFVEVGEWAST